MEAADFRNGEELSTNTLLIALDVPAVLNTRKEESYNFQLFPNPVTHTLYIYKKFDYTCKGIQAVVFNNFGQRVFSKEYECKDVIEIDVKGLPSGLYFMQLQSGSKLGISKFVKE